MQCWAPVLHPIPETGVSARVLARSPDTQVERVMGDNLGALLKPKR